MREAERIEEAVRATAVEVAGSIAMVAESVNTLRDEQSRRFGDRREQVRRETDVLRESRLAAIAAEENATRHAAETTLAASIDALAPGPAGAGWSDPWVIDPEAGMPRYLRVGGLDAAGTRGSDPRAALVPFLMSTGWFIRGDRKNASALVQSALLRVIASVPLQRLIIHVFDPRISGVAGVLAPIRSARAAALPAPLHSASGLADVLNGVADLAGRNAELIGARHLADLASLWESEGVPTGDLAIVVVLDYPTGISDVCHDLLMRLAETGPARGVSLLVTHDPEARAERGVQPKALRRALTTFDHQDRRWTVETLPGCAGFIDEGPPPASVIQPTVADVVRRAVDNRGPTIELGELLAPYMGTEWRDTADDELEAIIGRVGRQPLTIALRSENPPTPNMLIGGAVGQGKSNLLLDVIYSLAARYSPDELEMLLLDFKQGLEFKRFDRDADGRNWLPHARVLCLESNKAFGLSVLQFVSDEMIRRAELFNRVRCNGFSSYRKTTGEPLRRLLLIIDEFQVLFDGHDDMTGDAVRLFENIAKQGRAYGIHVLLSSQTVSGISGLQVKGDSIFAQFPIRVSLKNTREESEAILSRHNTAAAELTYRGEVIVNRNLGMTTDANERGIAAYAEPEDMTRLQAELWERAMGSGRIREPWVFLGRRAAQWPMAGAFVGNAQSTAGWIGRPMAITDSPVVADFDGADRGLALVGSGDDIARCVLGSLAFTALRGWDGGRVVVLNGLSGTTGDGADAVGAVMSSLIGQPIEVDVVDQAGIPEALAGLASTSVPTAVIALGLHRVDLTTEVSSNPETYESESGADVVKKIATGRTGAPTILIGWWPHVRALTESLGYDHDGIGTYVTLRIGIDDLRSIAGPHAIPPDGSPRVGVFNRNNDDGLVEVIPFEPIDATVVTRWARV